VDEEVRRLPEAYRLPVILCCLKGHTREEAARLLGWTEGSVKARLERGRARLHARLLRHGLTLAALAAVELSRDAASATASPTLMGSTAKAATLFAAGQAPASSSVAALAEGVLKAMLLKKLKAGSWALLIAVALGVGATALSYRTAAAEPARTADPTLPADAADCPPQGGDPRRAADAPRPAAPDKDELEALRLDVEALRVSLQATRERLKALEDEVRAQKGRADGAAPAKPRPDPSFAPKPPRR
jgi:hypothetical protein